MIHDSTRRTFLKAAGLGATASTLTGRTGATGITGFAADADGVVTRNDVDSRKGVGLAIATICVDGFGDENSTPHFASFRNSVTHTWSYVWYRVWCRHAAFAATRSGASGRA